jgi:pyrroloquinoline quinone (PQQ) biosynthesis protein C
MHLEAEILEYDRVRSGGICEVDMLQAYVASHLQYFLSNWICGVDSSLSVQNTEYRFQSLHNKSFQNL